MQEQPSVLNALTQEKPSVLNALSMWRVEGCAKLNECQGNGGKADKVACAACDGSLSLGRSMTRKEKIEIEEPKYLDYAVPNS